LFTNPIAPGECIEFATSPKRGQLAATPQDVFSKTFDIQRRFWVVFFPLPKTPAFMPYWVNAGIGISSRLAEETLEHIHLLRETAPEETAPQVSETPAHGVACERIAALLNRAIERQPVAAHDVYLYQTGVGAIYHVHKYLQQNRGPQVETTVLFGFAFLATAYTLNDFGPAYEFFGRADCDELEAWLEKEVKEGRRTRALVTEFPANPLLFTPDISRLRSLADRYGFLLVVDDTVGSFCNVDLLGPRGADILVTSLTKSFNGFSDAMAGSAVLNPCAQRYEELKALLEESYSNDFFVGDVEVLERNSRDYLARSATLNANARSLVEYFGRCVLDPSSSLLRVYHPSTNPTRTNYEACMRPVTTDFTPGFGGLFSIEFESTEAARVFYDTLGEILHIGPHLGAHVTIALVYVKILYGKELDVVGKFGLNERQVRISAGLEPIADLLDVFQTAMAAADKQKAKVERLESVLVGGKQAKSETTEIEAEIA
jgi:cystathionine gamma-synthase